MIINNIKIAWRNLSRHKLYSILNILGLSFGIACFLLIALYAIDEMTFDNFHSDSENIYRVVQHQQLPDEGEKHFGAVSYNIAGAAKNEIPGVEKSCKFFMFGRGTIRIPDKQEGYFHPFLTAENSIFEIFDFPFISGDPATSLVSPNTIVLSKEFAKKVFGNENPLGKTLRSDRGMDLEVTGVLESIPINSHLQFDALISHATIEALSFFTDRVRGDWASQNWGTYLSLQSGTDPISVGNQLTAFANERAQDDRPFKGELALQPLNDIHFGSGEIQRELNEGKSTYTYLYLFSLIGLFILGIACINYINLATARASIYSKEVGVRKAIGATFKQLFERFLSESIVYTLIAFAISLALVQAALPLFNSFTSKSISLFPSSSVWTVPLLLGIIVFVSLAAGSYPSLYLSKFRPQEVLKGSKNNEPGNNGWLRKGLVIMQFALSIIMIIGTLVAWQQMRFIQNQDLGFEREHILVVDINSGSVRRNSENIRIQYQQIPDVNSVTVSSRVPGEWKNLLQTEVRTPGKIDKKGQTPWFIGADENFLEAFDIKLISGRNFSRDRRADSSSIILNANAAESLGITEASGQEILLMSRINNGSERMLAHPMRAKLIGITSNFNFQSLYEPIAPLVLGYINNPIQSSDYITANISSNNIDQTIAKMTEILHSVDPSQLFEYHFLDDQIANFYEADIRRSKLFSIAALCAIFIACLGLFGLTAFTAQRRTKEIGIRKVLGASSTSIVALLAEEFLILVSVSLIVASPIAWYFLHDWLQNFAYHINIEWWVFIIAGVISMSIAFFTVSFQSYKAASVNPVISLRSE